MKINDVTANFIAAIIIILFLGSCFYGLFTLFENSRESAEKERKTETIEYLSVFSQLQINKTFNADSIQAINPSKVGVILKQATERNTVYRVYYSGEKIYFDGSYYTVRNSDKKIVAIWNR